MFLYRFLLLVILFFTSARARMVTVDDDDPRLSWGPRQVDSSDQCMDTSCVSTWWVTRSTQSPALARGEHFTNGPDTAMTFKFRGSQFMLFGSRWSSGGKAFVSVDGKGLGEITSYLDSDTGVSQQVLGNFTGLDAGSEHTVVVQFSYSGNNATDFKFVGIDFVLIDETDAKSPIIPVLIALCAVFGTLLAALVLTILYRRRQHRADENWERASLFTTVSGESRQAISVPRADGISFVATLEGRFPQRAPTTREAATAPTSPRSQRPMSEVSSRLTKAPTYKSSLKV